MNSDHPALRSLDDIHSLLQKLGPETVASRFQQAAFEIEGQRQKLEEEMDSFQQQRKQWELELQQSAVDIQEQSRELADAWLRLESERRNQRLVANASANHSTSDPEPQPPVIPDTSPRTTHTSDTDIGNRNANTPSLVEQFQLLQRERQAN